MGVLGRVCIILAYCALVTHVACANLLDNNRLLPPKHVGIERIEVDTQTGHFDQLLDHARPSRGTFRQRYYWSTQFYKGPGSPVVLWTPGESSLDGYQGYLTNGTIPGRFAQAIGGAVVLLEHRYFGQSSPVKVLNTETLQHLTLKNAVADFVHFARTAKLPFDKHGHSLATKAPWVFTGGSYSGALPAWTEQLSPGTFWAYHASSAVVETIHDFWQYFLPIRKGMPDKCAHNIVSVVKHVDHVLEHGTKSEVKHLKAKFGLKGVHHARDFASAIASPIYWQYGPNPSFCNALHKGRGGAKSRFQKALSGYAAYYKKYYARNPCPPPKKHDPKTRDWCLNSYNAKSSRYTDKGVNNNWGRQFDWLLCNEPFGWYQASAPKGKLGLIARHVTAKYYQRTCSLMFPPHNGHKVGSSRGRTEAQVNAYTKGWKHRRPSRRLMWANHEFDPWKSATVSSHQRPGGPQKSTAKEPVRITPGGYHCQDLVVPGSDDKSRLAKHTRKIISEEVAQMKRWVSEYPGHHHS